MSDFDWTERFPEMRPVRSAPAMMRVNGIGFAVYGSRDRDDETGTYVKTYCFSLLFFPAFAISAYRVADAAEGGWYFLGRVPLSGFAKGWNLLVVLAGLCLTGAILWHNHQESPESVARRKLAEADKFASNGEIVRAAKMYSEVSITGGPSSEAAGRLRGLLDDPQLHTSLSDAAGVIQVARDSKWLHFPNNDLETRGVTLIEQHAEADPRGALALIKILTPIAAEPKKLAQRRQSLLERLAARDPNDLATISELALLYEETNQPARCEELLLPRKDRLGDSEGARVLGELLVRKDKLDDACVLLERYTNRHLPELENAAIAFQSTMTGFINSIKNGSAIGFPYQQFKQSDDAGKQAILREYRETRFKDDPRLRQIHEKYREAHRVVTAALDLGIVLLRRAQSRANPAEREADLKKAEKVFVAIEKDEETASTKEFRVSLGQVYYWLGKHQEGHKQFEEALAAENRSSVMLIGLAQVLREVGERSEACALVEEAYNKETDRKKKFQMANYRAVMAVEVDEKIPWLERADADDVHVKANLCTTRAAKAFRDGNATEAETNLRQAIDLYAHMPEDATSLNNGALAHQSLYQITGDRSLLDKAGTMMDRAVALSPRDSILLGNAASALLDAALRDVIGNTIDLKLLKHSGDNALLYYLYADKAGKRRLLERLNAHPATVKATSYLERLLILAPKSVDAYRRLRILYADRRSAEKLNDLVAALQKSQPDQSTEKKIWLDYYAGKRDEKNRKEAESQLARYAKVMKEMKPEQRGVTFAVAAGESASLKMRLAMAGGAVDAGEVVALAESAHAAAPSNGTRRHLEEALLFRARETLTKKNPAYAAMVSQTRRSLESKDHLAFLLMQEGKPRQDALADADVKRVVELVRLSLKQFPDDPSKWAWIVLRAADAGEAEQLAKVIRADALEPVLPALDGKLSPFAAGTALRACWSLNVVGKDADGAAILKQYAARGVPMPKLP